MKQTTAKINQKIDELKKWVKENPEKAEILKNCAIVAGSLLLSYRIGYINGRIDGYVRGYSDCFKDLSLALEDF